MRNISVCRNGIIRTFALAVAERVAEKSTELKLAILNSHKKLRGSQTERRVAAQLIYRMSLRKSVARYKVTRIYLPRSRLSLRVLTYGFSPYNVLQSGNRNVTRKSQQFVIMLYHRCVIIEKERSSTKKKKIVLFRRK